ncbi:Arm DNA-binding domain-containing protein [Variovorax sp. PAMC26660]|uniref:Arm DNA-binding domain-containing protein n=1 Tax=Variovorax sp. PAMC26660 TaxID=2762322 RepID=UPI00164D5253|nr:Arm DNA-binding domain-containing protein [Variovorax sp. PAMC26660]QNK66815.1 DUF4102 domain-containing protein [Variovorax sp. PAMC26660]
MLTDTACRKTICPADKLRLRLADSGGLYLQIEPSGSRRWFWKYRVRAEVELSHWLSFRSAPTPRAKKAADTDADIQGMSAAGAMSALVSAGPVAR